MVNVTTKNSEAVVRTAQDNRPSHRLAQEASPLTLGIAPVSFSAETVQIGRLNPDKCETVDALRRKHADTHAFRFDARDETIANVALTSGGEPLGDVAEARVSENLLLLAEAIQHQLRRWLSRDRTILRRYRPLICLGRRDRLLANALQERGIETPDQRLDVLAKWSFDLRLVASSNPEQPPRLGLIVDVGTSHVIDIPVSEIIEYGFDPVGFYVGNLGDVDDGISSSRLRLLGRVVAVEGSTLVLDDLRDDADTDRVAASAAFIEPRGEILEAVVSSYYPRIAADVLTRLRHMRAPYLRGDHKLEKIRHTITELNKSLDSDSKPSNPCSASSNPSSASHASNCAASKRSKWNGCL